MIRRSPASRTTPFSNRRERFWVGGFCLAAMLHVFFFASAFPFFNNVDEQAHLDLVVRYSQGKIPRSFDAPNEETLPYLAGLGSLEYLHSPESQPGGHLPPPLWKLPPAQQAPLFRNREAAWKNTINHEVSQPPLYYTFGGLWWRLGKALGFAGFSLLYWLRLLNAIFLAVTVWLGWYVARGLLPENNFVPLAVPALIAFMPQTIFYAINNDVLSPLTFGLAFAVLLRFAAADTPTLSMALGVGLALAASYLTKTSNLPLLAAAALFLAGKILVLVRSGKGDVALRSVVIIFLAGALPIIVWMRWCQVYFGDVTGSNGKIQFLGWTVKPMADWLHHPLFTATGFWYFLKQNLATFGRENFSGMGNRWPSPPWIPCMRP